ncbi:1941_t:CDS:1, partial [Funneliformis geosporum]
MSATRVVNVTTTIKKEIKPLEEEKVEATTHLYSTKLSRTTSSRSTYEVKHHDDYLVGGNSEAESITSAKLLEEKERESSIQINSTSEKELPKIFGKCTECGQLNTGEKNWCRSCSS